MPAASNWKNMLLRQVDINCDMGEGVPNESALFPFISSANIACGGHTGDAYTMQQTVAASLEAGVAIGAHPSFPDRENFGRQIPSFHPEQLRSEILRQLEELSTIVEKNGARLHHVKPHGALYNLSAKDPKIAGLMADCVLEFDPNLILYGLSGSLSITIAREKAVRTAAEVFADRGYLPDGSLIARIDPGALLTKEKDWLEQVQFFLDGRLPGDPSTLLSVETICVHSDTPNALEIAKSINGFLKNKAIDIIALV